MNLLHRIFRHHIVRYIFSGGTAAAVNIGLLYLFTSVIGLHYIASGILAFCIAVVVSFFMQKKWTFGDHSTKETHKKFTVFIIVAIINLGVNTLLLYLFTDILHVYYIISQFIASALVAIWSYFIYKVVFKNQA